MNSWFQRQTRAVTYGLFAPQTFVYPAGLKTRRDSIERIIDVLKVDSGEPSPTGVTCSSELQNQRPDLTAVLNVP